MIEAGESFITLFPKSNTEVEKLLPVATNKSPELSITVPSPPPHIAPASPVGTW
jgi:hypothetical protein